MWCLLILILTVWLENPRNVRSRCRLMWREGCGGERWRVLVVMVEILILPRD